MAVMSAGCDKQASPGRQEIPQVDPTTFVYDGQTYAVVDKPVGTGQFEVEVSGVARAMTNAPGDGQTAVNVGAQYLAQKGVCGGPVVPGLVLGSQSFDPTHEFWKQQYRCS